VHDGAEVRVHDDHLRVRVADDVLELRRRMSDGERNRDAAGPPDPPLRGDIGKAGRGEKRHARLREVVAAGEQACGDPTRCLE